MALVDIDEKLYEVAERRLQRLTPICSPNGSSRFVKMIFTQKLSDASRVRVRSGVPVCRVDARNAYTRRNDDWRGTLREKARLFQNALKFYQHALPIIAVYRVRFRRRLRMWRGFSRRNVGSS